MLPKAHSTGSPRLRPKPTGCDRRCAQHPAGGTRAGTRAQLRSHPVGFGRRQGAPGCGMGFRWEAYLDAAGTAGNRLAPRGMGRDCIAAFLLDNCQLEGQSAGSAVRTLMEFAVQRHFAGALCGTTSCWIRNSARDRIGSALSWARLFRSHGNGVGVLRCLRCIAVGNDPTRLEDPSRRFPSRRIRSRGARGTAAAHRRLAAIEGGSGQNAGKGRAALKSDLEYQKAPADNPIGATLRVTICGARWSILGSCSKAAWIWRGSRTPVRDRGGWRSISWCGMTA